MSTISSGIAAILDLIHLSMEANDLELSQTVMLNVHRKQMQYFEVFSETIQLDTYFFGRISFKFQIENSL